MVNNSTPIGPGGPQKPGLSLEKMSSGVQALSALATVIVLIVVLVRFWNLDEVAKKSETTSKAVSAQYDKSRRVRSNNELSVEADKLPPTAPLHLYSAGWWNEVTNISKKPIMITAVWERCFVAPVPPELRDGLKAVFVPFELPEVGKTGPWSDVFNEVWALDVEQFEGKPFSSEVLQSFKRDQKEFLKEYREPVRKDHFLPGVLQPDESAGETQGFVVRAPRYSDVACRSSIRICVEGEKCDEISLADSSHFWLVSEDRKQKE